MQAFLDERDRNTLERHMGFPGQWDEHRRFQIDELKKLGLMPASSVLEIGCGPLTAGLPVIRYLEPDCYVGVDVRSSVLNNAWQEIGKHELSGKNPRLIRSDDFGSKELENCTFDFIWTFSVLFHLSDAILDNYFANIAKRLGGVAVANVQTNIDDSTWLEFPFLKRTVEDYREAAAKHGLQTTELGTLEQRGFKLTGAERENSLLMFKRSAMDKNDGLEAGERHVELA